MATRIPDRDKLIIELLRRFGMMTADQIKATVFANLDYESRRVISARRLSRLTKAGKIRRFGRMIGGVGGSSCYVYTHKSNTHRVAVPHTLEIAELWSRLFTADIRKQLTLEFYDPEPASYYYVGPRLVKPDAIISVNGKQYYVEIDLATETTVVLGEKMKYYKLSYEANNLMPKVLFVVPDEARKRQIERLIPRYDRSHDYTLVVTIDEACSALA